MGASGRTITPSDPGIVALDARAAGRIELGAKATNLATARAARLPVVDGFVLTPALARDLARCPRPAAGPSQPLDAVRRAWAALSRNGSDPVVVRSSSTTEDTASSSLAGVYESVVDVRGWDAFLDALCTVVGSAVRVDGEGASLPVLVQRHVDPAWGGVMFGVDPVTGQRDRLVLAVVRGGPQRLVAGEEAGVRLVLDRRGRIVEGRRVAAPLPWSTRRRLAELAGHVEHLYGAPQDVEWAITDDGQVLLLQSRPVTAMGEPATGPMLGPGPVAETFPDPLRALEVDLWITPLRDALRAVLPVTGRASARQVDRSPVVAVIDGRPAVDIDLFEPPARRRGLARLDPRPPLRRLRVAWQVGRLRAGLPVLLDGMIADLDRDLAAVPPLEELSDEELLGLLWRASAALRAAHGHELLAGVLATAGAESGTAAEAALAALARATGDGTTADDGDLIARSPEVLALVPPAIGAPTVLPVVAPGRGSRAAVLGQREALRLRIRWLHELSARAARALGHRLARQGLLDAPGDVADVRLASLAAAVHHGRTARTCAAPGSSPPLPARFRLTRSGRPVPVTEPASAAEGTAAGGGRGAGPAAHDLDPEPGSVLVVATLDPRLAPVLGRLSGLVAETGSPLSHLAILAREHGVPTVVGVADARRRYPEGAELLVDGTTGQIEILSPAPTAGAEAAP